MDEKLEMAQLLARFKLMVKRSLSESVDLERLTREPEYARQRLSEIEEAALDEELLIMVLRLRDILVPAVPLAGAVPTPPPGTEISDKEIRKYKLGARAW